MSEGSLSIISNRQEEGGLRTGQKLLENTETAGSLALRLHFQRCLPRADNFLRPEMETQGGMHWPARKRPRELRCPRWSWKMVAQVGNPTAQLGSLSLWPRGDGMTTTP